VTPASPAPGETVDVVSTIPCPLPPGYQGPSSVNASLDRTLTTDNSTAEANGDVAGDGSWAIRGFRIPPTASPGSYYVHVACNATGPSGTSGYYKVYAPTPLVVAKADTAVAYTVTPPSAAPGESVDVVSTIPCPLPPGYQGPTSVNASLDRTLTTDNSTAEADGDVAGDGSWAIRGFLVPTTASPGSYYLDVSCNAHDPSGASGYYKVYAPTAFVVVAH
jgi:hypothetical protein